METEDRMMTGKYYKVSRLGSSYIGNNETRQRWSGEWVCLDEVAGVVMADWVQVGTWRDAEKCRSVVTGLVKKTTTAEPMVLKTTGAEQTGLKTPSAEQAELRTTTADQVELEITMEVQVELSEQEITMEVQVELSEQEITMVELKI